jgi:hypothetical protein
MTACVRHRVVGVGAVRVCLDCGGRMVPQPPPPPPPQSGGYQNRRGLRPVSLVQIAAMAGCLAFLVFCAYVGFNCR